MVKKANPTAKKKKTPKKLTWFETYKFMNSWNLRKVSDTFLDKLCEEMMNHFENRNNICVIRFLSDKGIVYQSFLNWTERHSNLKEVYTLVKQRIGSKREELAVRREENCDPKTLHYTLRHYNPYWKSCFEEESSLKLKAAEKGSSETKVVIIKDFDEEQDVTK